VGGCFKDLAPKILQSFLQSPGPNESTPTCFRRRWRQLRNDAAHWGASEILWNYKWCQRLCIAVMGSSPYHLALRTSWRTSWTRQCRLDPWRGHSCAHSPGRMGHTLWSRILGLIQPGRTITTAAREHRIHDSRLMGSTRSQLRVACRHSRRKRKMLGRAAKVLVARFLQMQWPQQVPRAAIKANHLNDSCGIRTQALTDLRLEAAP
jgi:hypothetical protein